ncbi:type IIL restriction-modification enzyme MmeI, partial [Sneathiella sp.]|uniref:type IIL restriction-modification enzyme MmeI n=1 Tax=Sneathiella sp. TaxID=1964365 RepID=UPI003422133B
LSSQELEGMQLAEIQRRRLTRRVFGSAEFIRGNERHCIWVEDCDLQEAISVPAIRDRIEAVRVMRSSSRDKGTQKMAARPHQFREMHSSRNHTIILPGVSSEGREYLQAGLLDNQSVVTNLAFAMYDAPVWSLALLSSRVHLVWVATVCGQLETRLRYSNTLGWNTFPLPKLTEKNKEDLTRSAEDILLAREAHFPATIADLYDPEKMPDDLRAAHDRNDEVLERIYIGRRFKNDTERLEKLFELYTKMTAANDLKKTNTRMKA